MAYHQCPTCGMECEGPAAEPVVTDLVSAEKVAAAVGESEVRIAEINAGRDVQTAKVYARRNDEETVAAMAGMQARIDVLEAAMAPPAEPEPVVIPVPEPAAPAEPVAGPPETAPRSEGKPKKKGFFS